MMCLSPLLTVPGRLPDGVERVLDDACRADVLLTRDGDVALMLARRYRAPLHWRITGSRMAVEPLPDIDWSRPHIFLMNHQSALDIPCAFAALPVNLRFVASEPGRRPTAGVQPRNAHLRHLAGLSLSTTPSTARDAGPRSRTPPGPLSPSEQGPARPLLTCPSDAPGVPSGADVVAQHPLTGRAAREPKTR